MRYSLYLQICREMALRMIGALEQNDFRTIRHLCEQWKNFESNHNHFPNSDKHIYPWIIQQAEDPDVNRFGLEIALACEIDEVLPAAIRHAYREEARETL